MIKNLLKAAS